jgi:hypothetical protein
MDTTKELTCLKCGGPLLVPPQGTGNPGRCPRCGQPVVVVAPEPAPAGISGPEVYNIVSDLGAGLNLRWRDNVFQLAAIGVCTALGMVIGLLAAPAADRGPAALLGGFAGVLAGLFGSGIFIMVYRFIRHIRGRHD